MEYLNSEAMSVAVFGAALALLMVGWVRLLDGWKREARRMHAVAALTFSSIPVVLGNLFVAYAIFFRPGAGSLRGVIYVGLGLSLAATVVSGFASECNDKWVLRLTFPLSLVMTLFYFLLMLPQGV